MAEDLNEALANLKLGYTGLDDDVKTEVYHNLQLILKQLKLEGNSKEPLVEQLIQGGVVELLINLLKLSNLPSNVTAAVSEVIAELNKTDIARKICTDITLIKLLLELLKAEDHHVILQTCRALGNICYDNNSAHSLVQENDGVKKLLCLLQHLMETSDLPANLYGVASGCLLNLTDAHEEIQEQAIEAGVVNILLQYMEKFSSMDDAVTHCLLILNYLADLDSAQKQLMEKPCLISLMNVLDTPLTTDNLEYIMELLGNLAEIDNTKLDLAEMGMCEKLLGLLNKYQNSEEEESQNIIKLLSDLIILILTGDSSMEFLYQGSEGFVYKETLAWLKNADENLHVAGALAAGNFARKDDHCIQMVKGGVAEDLLSVLENHAGQEGDIRLQHAVLSAFRNLAIPAQNKPILVNLGVVDKILPMMAVDTFPVVFKLLATFRMLVDKQEDVANMLGQNSEFVKRVVDWCPIESHPGVRGEAIRLLASLAKNTKTPAVMQTLVSNAAIPCMVSMLKSEHVVMQNEALVAVTLLATNILSENETAFQQSGLVSALQHLLKSEKIASELLQNVLTLITILTRSALVRSDIINAGLRTDLEALTEHCESDISQKAKDALMGLDTP